LITGCSIKSVSDTPAPTRTPDLPSPAISFSSRSRATLMTVFGVCCRRFMFGYRSVPPATNCPFIPASPIIFTASATVRGAR
jgi:hypothetical protein